MGWRMDRLGAPVGSAEGDGVDRRDFVKACMMAAAAVGLPASAGIKWAEAAEAGLKPSVIWLHFQECTGCTESLLRTSQPGIAELILDLVSLDYHETLFAAAGYQIEEALHQAMEAHAGQYICVVEGAIPRKDGGIYCQIGGRTAIDILNDVASKAAAVVAIGSCASWGGIPSADPNPTDAVGAPQILEGTTVVTIPGCPANPYNFLGTVLAVRRSGNAAGTRRQGTAAVCLRPHHPRALPAPRALRRRPLRPRVRRRGPPSGLLPVRARMQGSRDPRQLLGHEFR